MKKRVHTKKYLHNTRKELRNSSTKQENILWYRINNKKLGYKFRRQHSIGNFIADFYCPEKKLVIEVDGSQHLDNQEYDIERTSYFESLGIKVIRFWNDEINSNLNGVLMRIEEDLNSQSKHFS